MDSGFVYDSDNGPHYREENVAEAPAPVEAPAIGEPMDLMTALQMVLKKSLACHSLARGLHEVTKAIERGEAQLVVLAQDCDMGDYVKLIEGLCKEKDISLVRVPKNTQLGEWVGVCCWRAMPGGLF